MASTASTSKDDETVLISIKELLLLPEELRTALAHIKVDAINFQYETLTSRLWFVKPRANILKVVPDRYCTSKATVGDFLIFSPSDPKSMDAKFFINRDEFKKAIEMISSLSVLKDIFNNTKK